MATLNFNIGVLGHVDSGKTSLAKALSTVASTACFDKNPQSKQRGITLDLGFSSFTIHSSGELKKNGFDYVQYTLVDCPGHASLIKTIIGGAQIIDMMLLVIDITKGVQTQTAECLIIGEICCDKMLIVLNKLDLVEESKRQATIEKISKRLLKTLENTKFANSPIVAVAANPSDGLSQATENLSLEEGASKQQSLNGMNITSLIEKLREVTFLPNRTNINGQFLFAVDHCFSIRGQGTVMTGTVLEGTVKVNDNIEIPSFKQQKKVKSIQIFRKSVDKAVQGDRCGVCLANFDSKQFERGIICAPDHVRNAYSVIISFNKIKHFKNQIESGSKFHITIGHETLIGKVELFGSLTSDDESTTRFNFSQEYLHLDEYNTNEQKQESNDNDKENSAVESKEAKKHHEIKRYFALIDFVNESEAQSVLCTQNSLVIGSKLDTDIHLNQCRIAFYGKVLHLFTNKDFRESSSASNQPPANAASSASTQVNYHLSQLKVYKEKQKEGVVERKHDEYTLIGRSLFKKETNIGLFAGLKVDLSTGEKGVIEGAFGQSGKFKIRLSSELSKAARDLLDSKSNAKSGKKTSSQEPSEVVSSENQSTAFTGQIRIFLKFKRFIYDDKKKMVQ